MHKRITKNLLGVLFILLFFISKVNAQILPIPFEKRVEFAEHIVIGKVIEKIPYWDNLHHNIYTLNIIEVSAYLKGYQNNTQIAVISLGGIVGNQMEISYPSVKVDEGEVLLIMLNANNTSLDNKDFRATQPSILQCQASTNASSLLRFKKGKYIDILEEQPMTEIDLISKINTITGILPKMPNGNEFRVRTYENTADLTFRAVTSINNGANTNPSSYFSGTIDTGNELVITGSGFGGAIGTVEFPNADSGGSTTVTQAVASDIVSWSDTEIRIKIPKGAGTGTLEVITNGGASAGTHAITIDYAILNVNSTFSGWGISSRNRLELIDDNGSGGYTFEYNNDVLNSGTSFSDNALAKAAFERALATWRCNTFVNLDRDDTGTTVDFANDGTNIVTFAAGLSGALGVTTSRFSGTANGGCTQINTLWYLNEIDVRFAMDSGLPATTSWNYGPGASTPGGLTYDFETIALHELGHAHGLGHIITLGEVMHYTISNGTDTRILSAADIAGGTHKISHSTVANCIATPSEMTVLTGANCALLPIELTYFSASSKEKEVLLQWETTSEFENHFFTLERSSDARTFEKIAKIEGAGTSFESITYAYKDKNPLSGVSYYRLKQTDFNGNFTYSQVQSVEIKGLNLDLRVYPNPLSSDKMSLSFNKAEGVLKSIQIFDAAGQLQFSQGDLHQNKLDLNLFHLPKGIYFLKVETLAGQVFERRFVRM